MLEKNQIETNEYIKKVEENIDNKIKNIEGNIKCNIINKKQFHNYMM